MTTALTMRRREIHAASAKVLSPTAMMLMPYRGKLGSVSPGFEFKPGFIYAQVRAISARINQNYDGWPSQELKKSYRSFIGKPIFVNHQNFDPKLARGKVVASRYVEAGDDKYIETVMEIDAQRFPILAHEIKTGGMDSVSMGVEAGFTICSVCNNKAIDTPDFCDHVRFHKGQVLRTASGEDTLVYEKCYKLGFFELSYVFDPADETAVVSRVIAASATPTKAAPMNIRDIEARIELLAGPLDIGDPNTNPDLNNPTAPTTTPVMPKTTPAAGTQSDGSWSRSTDTTPIGGGSSYTVQPGDTLSDIAQRSGIGDYNSLAQGNGISNPNMITPGEKINIPGAPAPTGGTPPTVEGKPDTDVTKNNWFGTPPLSSTPKPTGQSWGSPKPPSAGGVNPIPGGGTLSPKPMTPSVPKIPSAGGVNPIPGGGTLTQTKPKMGRLEARINYLAYGEIQAPEDVDTLRQDDVDENPFQNLNESPQELQGPNLDATKRLDRAQEDQGLDTNRNVEDVEDIGGRRPPRAARSLRPHIPKEARAMARNRYRADVLVDPRTGRRYYAADDDPSSAPAESDEDLIAEAEDDLEKADQAAQDDSDDDGADGDPASDGGGTDDDYSDAPDDDSDDDSDDDDSDASDGGGGSEDLPPWLENGDSKDDSAPPSKESRRRSANQRTSTQKKRRTRKGAPMGLQDRQRVASAQWPRRHYADESGNTDGGPYHTDDNDQGAQEEVFLSQTPGSEAVSAPVPGDGTISNTENSLVARIQRRNAEQQRDIIAYEQISGRRVNAGEHSLQPGFGDQVNPYSGTTGGSQIESGGDNSWTDFNPAKIGVRRQGEAVEQPDTVNPSLSGTDDQSVKSGDWDNIALDDVQTQPKDASLHAFAAFDRWLQQTTGRTARQHGNPVFIRRSAARFCQGTGMNVEAMFPALGNVLREARRNEGSSSRRSNMRRRADESLDVAAPQDRIDVEKPVSNTTDSEAQASQFDLGDFGGNASDNLADPDLSADSQIWAPGEGDSSKTSNRKADGIAAVRYAEAYIQAGLAPNTSAEKWKIAGLAQTMRHGTIVDRTRLLDAINTQRAASVRRTAGVNRGAGNSVPPGFGRALTAGTAHNAGNDLSDDVGLWLK